MSFWQITYNGVTKDASAWGIGNIHRRRKSAATDTVTFSMPGTPFDSVLPFVYKQPLSITRNGIPWFSGIVTKPQPKGKANSEMINYEISGPWWFLEHTQFQQMWAAVNPTTGQADATMSTTRSNTILGQSLDGFKINSGQVINEVLLYAQYAYQLVDFPKTVTLAHLPPAPPANTPFQIGLITPNVVIPYSQVRDKSCADIIRLMMKYSPDCVAWMDYSTSPPTLNISQRQVMAGSGAGSNKKTISVLNGTTKLVNAFNPEPRYDLQVPVVVVKFEQKNTINGVTLDNVTVDSYPPPPPGVTQNAWNSQPGAWVQTIDLVGGQVTMQTADIKVIARPTSLASTVLNSWMLYKEPWLSQTQNGSIPGTGNPYTFDQANVGIVKLVTAIDPNDPLNDPNKNPNNITLPGCPQLVNELLTSQFYPWLQDAPNALDAAKVQITVWLKYSGTDPATAALFTYDPTNALVPLAPGTGFMVHTYTTKVTNASTQKYSQVTSKSAGEPVPTGFAQYLYNCLAQLHFAGSLTTIEQECSDVLPPGCVFNTTDGNTDWQSMNALVLSVEEEIDMGITTVEFGPPAMLGLAELAELFRINVGRLPSFKLSQRTTGQFDSGNNVIGGTHGADTNTSAPPVAPATAQVGPFTITYGTNPGASTYWIMVTLNGIFLNTDGSAVTLTNAGTKFNLQPNDTVWMEASVSGLATTTVAIKSYGHADGGLSNQNAYWVNGGLTENDGATPPNQTIFRKVIATFVANAKGAPTLTTRQTTTNLQLRTGFVQNEPILYPDPI